MSQIGLEDKFKGMGLVEKPNPEMQRMSTILKEDAENFLKEKKVEVGSSQMAPKIGSIHKGGVRLVTNVHGMVTNANVSFYRYQVTIKGVFVTKDQSEISREISQYMSADAQKSDRRARCRDLIALLKNRRDSCLAGKRCVYFDLQSIIFSMDQLQDGITLNVLNSDMPVRVLDHEKFYRYEVHIQKVEEGFQVKLGDFSGLSNDLALSDHSLAQFLDIATSQYAFFHPDEHVTFSTKLSFLMDPTSYGFKPADTEYFEDTQSYLAIGANKAVKFIEGPMEKSRALGVVVQTKKTPFHSEICLLEKAKKFIHPHDLLKYREDDRVELDGYLKGLWIQTSHGKKAQRFSIKKVSQSSAKSYSFPYKEQEISVEQYFADAYNIKLTASTAPLIECKGRQKVVIFLPMEVCFVCEDQRVSSEQMTSSMTQLSIRKCAVPPSILLEQNKKTAASLHLWKNSELSSADIKVLEVPMELQAHSINPPTIEFASGKQLRITEKFTWLGDRYLIPGKCGSWGAYAFLTDQEKNYLSQSMLERFLNIFVDQCKQRGIEIAYPDDVGIYECSYESIVECFKYSVDNCFEFLFAIHGDIGPDVHARIKYVERNFSITSQALRLSTLKNVVEKNQRLTLQNIVNKTNIKFGGLNYSLQLRDKGAIDALNSSTLYIGIGSSHPGGGYKMKPQELIQKIADDTPRPAPTVVGYSANIGPNIHSFEFVGDFVYQEPLREEKFDVMHVIVERCTSLFKIRRNFFPDRVVVFRGGCGEGQFKMVLEYEVPLVKYALRELQCDAKLTVIAVNKLQEVRFFNKTIDVTQKPDSQNIQPGVVVDHTVVNPVFNEFFLNSHRALQGTARTPKYTVLLDESKMVLAQIESMAYHLCYGHQIVYLPTSLPTPLFVANRYAERGRMLYQQHMAHGGSQLSDYKELTNELCFFKTKNLFGYRVNA